MLEIWNLFTVCLQATGNKTYPSRCGKNDKMTSKMYDLQQLLCRFGAYGALYFLIYDVRLEIVKIMFQNKKTIKIASLFWRMIIPTGKNSKIKKCPAAWQLRGIIYSKV